MTHGISRLAYSWLLLSELPSCLLGFWRYRHFHKFITLTKLPTKLSPHSPPLHILVKASVATMMSALLKMVFLLIVAMVLSVTTVEAQHGCDLSLT